MAIERKLAAIMFTDIVGFTKIMGDDESTALSILENQQSLINPLVKEHKGNIIKKTGDGFLIDFPSTVEAVECATQMQDSIKLYNTSDDNLEFHMRIGIHLGDVVILGDDILGDGVNIASRVEPLASPDGICITDAVYQSVKSKLKLDAERIDEVDLKHIDEKYTIYKLPKKTEKDDDSQLTNEIHLTKIEINTIANETNVLKALFKVFPYIFFSASLGFNYKLILILIRDILNADFTRILYELNDIIYIFNNQLRLILLPLTILIIISFLGSFFVSKWTYKMQFKDIRNVSSLLDTLIMHYGYKIVNQSKNNIEYLHLPKVNFLFNFFRKSKYNPKFLTEMDILRIQFNGNTIIIEGMFYHVKRILWHLKKHNK